MKTSKYPTRSVCPICLQVIDAFRVERDGAIYLEKQCPEHGDFSVPIWRGRTDIGKWISGTTDLAVPDRALCPHGCANCGGHPQRSCCVLLEVTSRCNLSCRFCFAQSNYSEPNLLDLKHAIACIARDGSKPLLQLSGGEPTLRDDLPELIAHARQQGITDIQLNTNGLRLAEEEGYAESLASAGLSFVFLQFDGTEDGIYKVLRGKYLLEKKLRAIENCDRNKIGVTLVPTVVRGVNDRNIGDILRLGASLSPSVRGVHFQPVSWFGRIPGIPAESDRYTLGELIDDVYDQGVLEDGSLTPSMCDHPLCGFHGTFLVEKGALKPLAVARTECCCGQTTPEQNRAYIATKWKRTPEPINSPCEVDSIDDFLQQTREKIFTVTAMAFQDAMNLDLIRLRRCSLHVYDAGVLRPFCAKYLTPLGGA